MKLKSSIVVSFLLLGGVSTAFHCPSLASRGASTSKLCSNAFNDDIVVAVDVAGGSEIAIPTDGSQSSAGGDIISPITIPTPTQFSSPGYDENVLFDCDPSVEYWRSFQYDGDWTVQQNLEEVANIATRFATMGPDAWSYWVRHAGRSGYFAGNAVLGTLASNLHERLVNNNDKGVELPFKLNPSVASRLILEAFLCYEQDYARIKDGQYTEPWDMEPNHRQSSPLNVLTQTSRFVNEAIGTLARRNRQSEEDKKIWITDPAMPTLYPEYYQTAFHYQTDGWMSKRSAGVYETSTETLFLGRQDAMQRISLPPLVQLAKRYNNSSREGPMKVLEVACGTGRFMTFVRDNLPLDTECTAVDLSPYYLDAARDNDVYWRRTRREKENSSSGDNDNRKVNTIIGKDDIKPLRLIQAQAENLPFDDEYFDAVVCIYLYHELPRNVRAKVSEEMARVLKKDGIVVLTDSAQRGDRPALDDRLQNFGNMNEPYYLDYSQDNLPEHFKKVGLKPVSKVVRSTTKSLTFIK